ncbi:ARM repeat-containing protein [Hesseltinella vesiculosa]|uniref:non-specific serine/threonine protein kinase n=1 Tax=Hesseltinella vesiculosa TaxID=101127 RepID=A0A1X2GXT6_9FUNG|nr:ARM repeat-containing protein [Hesseltinella vesiculosa]
MGNNLSNVTTIVGVDSYVSELGDVAYEKSLGTARFMKTVRGRHNDGMVVVKIFAKPKLGLSLKEYAKRMKREYEAVSSVPNVFSYQKLLETDRAAYMVRQYFYSSLYDRISTRPFLTLVEKKWIAYQILRGVADCHKHKVYHGDIKTENVLVTSWNWVYLVDFAFYKPTFLPEDDPANFSFFFDTSSRRTCYIAPERFYKAGTDIDQCMKALGQGDINNVICELTPAMDVFSVGCVIAELFLEGTPIFSLSQLFKYKNGEYSPAQALDKIEDPDIKDLILHMIQLDQDKRLSAEVYLTQWRGKAFPEYFYEFLHDYIGLLTDKSGTLPSMIQTVKDSFITAMSSSFTRLTQPVQKLVNADEKIERLYYDFDQLARLLLDTNDTQMQKSGERRRTISDIPSTTNTSIVLPPTLNIPNYTSREKINHHETNAGEQGFLILLSFISSQIRNVTYSSSKLKALDIILALAEHLPDDVKLDRLIPYVMALLTDESALVRAGAIKVLTQVLCMVESISPINAQIFPEYILPSVREFATDTNALVRITYASCIAMLAETALRFLEMAQLLTTDSTFPMAEMDLEEVDFDTTYDASLQDLQQVIQEQVTTLLIDSDSSVKRTLLTNITCLCVFFGRQKANDVLLSHMITYLNDKDWMLRSAFFESVKGVGTFVGARSLEEYILPLMVQALTDSEEFVVEKVLNSLTSLADLGLFQKMKLWELVGIISPLICHPSVWLRYGAVGFIASATKHLSQTDRWCIIYPLLKPFLRSDIAEISEQQILENAKSPIPRQVYNQAITWASKASPHSAYWKALRDKKGHLNPTPPASKTNSRGGLIRQGSLFNNFVPVDDMIKTKEDEDNLQRLRQIGMAPEDEVKLGYLREYIFKVSRTKSSRPESIDLSSTNGEVYLKDLGVTPLTVFLPDMSQQPEQPSQQPSEQVSSSHPRSSSTSTPAPETSLTTSTAHEHRITTVYKLLKNQPADNRVGYTHLQNILYKTALDAFPTTSPEFTGEPNISKRLRRLPAGASPFRTINSWKPEGILVAHYKEHTAAVNQLDISWDNLLFASCSDDGSVKVWDCSRLERNVTNRSRVSYNKQGGCIKCLTFIQHTYSIASASDNGSIHVFRVDVRSAGSSLKFSKCVTLREYQLKNEFAVAIQHFTSNAMNTVTGSKSILLVATNMGNIYLLDLMTMTPLATLHNKKSYGIITAMATDRMHAWLLVGTSRGILTLYDLRFQVPVQTWLHPSKSRISAICLNLHPRAESKQVMIASGRNEWSIWDIVDLHCLQVFGAKSVDDKSLGAHAQNYKALPVPSDAEIMTQSFTDQEANFVENSIQALATLSGCPFVFTGGADRKLRFWDLQRIDNSAVILGLDLDEPKPRYSASTVDQIKFHVECPPQRPTQPAGSRSNAQPIHPKHPVAQQQFLMRNPTDAITDIILTELPYPMVICSDRDGAIKVIS